MEGTYILINVLFIIIYFICDKIIFRTCIFYTFFGSWKDDNSKGGAKGKG